MKVGDTVRFLSETGGGRVSGFQGRNIVLVEDNDGFEIPMAITDVVVVESDDYSTAKVASRQQPTEGQADATVRMSTKQKMAVGVAAQDEEKDADYDPADREVTFRPPAEERKGGDKLSVYLAFVPVDIKEFANTRFECYLVNDSNYHIRYNMLLAESHNWHVKSLGEVEPNTSNFVDEVGRDDLNAFKHLALQMMAYKNDKYFVLKPTVDVRLRLDAVKFYKLHCFRENEFFEEPALILTVIENDEQPRPLAVDANKLRREMYAKSIGDNGAKPRQPRKADTPEVVVVDLHANEVLDTTAGMSNSDILKYQLKVMHDTLTAYADRKGQQIVFIHGKGEGVLRRAIIDELTYKYKRYPHQDASFQEYGYGATQVTIK